jgi:class 3 adenylate cyclase
MSPLVVDRDLILKNGLHAGAAIAVTLNDRLFGQTVKIAAHVQNLANADEIYVSHDVFHGEGVHERLATLEGIRSNLRVYA